MKKIAIILSVLLMVFVSSCDDDDGSENNGNNGNNSNNVNNTNNDDLETAYFGYTGAQFGTFDYDSDTNYIDCMEGGGTLWLNAYQVGGSIDYGVAITIGNYTGPGQYAFNYDTMAFGAFSFDVKVGLYKYNFFYDFSRIDFHEEYSDCVLDITETDGWLDADISCTFLPAMNISADYEDSPEEFQPAVNITGSMSCIL